MLRGMNARSRPQTTTRLGPSFATLLLLAVLGGCTTEQGTYVGRPDNPIFATETLGTLETVIPEPVPVRSVMAASEATLRDRGYTIWSRRTTDEVGRVEARPPNRDFGGRWIVEARVAGPGRTTLSVRCTGWDGEQSARALMDEILHRLGM